MVSDLTKRMLGGRWVPGGEVQRLKAENEHLHAIFKSVGVPMTARAFMDELDRLRKLESAYVRSEEECEHLHALLDRVEELMRAEEHWGLREILAERGIRRFQVLDVQ